MSYRPLADEFLAFRIDTIINARPLRPPPSKVSTPPSRAGPVDKLYDRDRGERYNGERYIIPGQSADLRARPASITPVRTKANALETQASGGASSVTFDCYGTPVTVTNGNSAVCDGS